MFLEIFPEINKEIFYISNITFSIILLLDILRNMRRKKTWFDPYSLIILKNFLLGYGITAFISMYYNLNEFHNTFEILNNAMIFINIAYITINIVYNSRAFNKVIDKLISKSDRYIRTDFKINWYWLYAVYFISITIRLILVNQGVYGYLSTIKQETSSLPGFIANLSSLGNIILFIVLLNYYKYKNKRTITVLFFIIEFLFALTAGFKGAIVILFIFLFLAMYLAQRKIKWFTIVFGFVSISFSYSYVEPYRDFLQANTNITSIDGFLKGAEYVTKNIKKSSKIDDESSLNKVFSRFGYLNEFSRMVNYKMNRSDLNTPDFKLRFWQAPLITAVPRFLWKDKPSNILGITFITWKVKGNNTSISSSAFGPIGSLYFTGIIYIILGFIFYSFIIKFISSSFQVNKIGFLMIGLALFYSIFNLESEFSFIFATIFQTTFLAFIGQLFLFRKY